MAKGKSGVTKASAAKSSGGTKGSSQLQGTIAANDTTMAPHKAAPTDMRGMQKVAGDTRLPQGRAVDPPMSPKPTPTTGALSPKGRSSAGKNRGH